MFHKVAEYYRKGETGKGIKLLTKVLLKMARNDRLRAETSPKTLKKTAKKAAVKKSSQKKSTPKQKA